MRWLSNPFWSNGATQTETSAATHLWAQTLHDLKESRTLELGRPQIDILRGFPCEYLTPDNLRRDLNSTFEIAGLVSAYEYLMVITEQIKACQAPEGDVFNQQLRSSERSLSDTMEGIHKIVRGAAESTVTEARKLIKRLFQWLTAERAEKFFFAEILLPKAVQDRVYRRFIDTKTDPAAPMERHAEFLTSIAIQEAKIEAETLLRRPLWIYALAIFASLSLLGAFAYSRYFA